MYYEKAEDAYYHPVQIEGIEGLFTDSRIEFESIPKGLHRYEVRYSDLGAKPCELAHTIWANHYGTILTNRIFKLDQFGQHDFDPNSFIVFNEPMQIQAFLKLHPIEEVETHIAAACDHELCYQHDSNEKERGLVGYVRGDFGAGGKEFWHSWWPSSDEEKNTPEFKEQLQICIDSLRVYGPLRDFETMEKFCDAHEEARIPNAWLRSYAFRSYTKDYTFITRCSPIRGDYNFYVWCYATKDLLRARQKEKQLLTTKNLKKKKVHPEPER